MGGLPPPAVKANDVALVTQTTTPTKSQLGNCHMFGFRTCTRHAIVNVGQCVQEKKQDVPKSKASCDVYVARSRVILETVACGGQ